MCLLRTLMCVSRVFDVTISCSMLMLLGVLKVDLMRLPEFIPYNCFRCARSPNLVNGTLERNDNARFSTCCRMRVGMKKNRLTKLNNDNMKEFAIAIRIAKDQRGRMAENF